MTDSTGPAAVGSSSAHFSGGDGHSKTCITVDGQTRCEESSGNDDGITLKCVSINGEIKCDRPSHGRSLLSDSTGPAVVGSSSAHFSGGNGHSKSCVTVDGQTRCEESSGTEGDTTLECVSIKGEIKCDRTSHGRSLLSEGTGPAVVGSSSAHFSGGNGHSKSCVTVNGETTCDESSGTEGGTELECVSINGEPTKCETSSQRDLLMDSSGPAVVGSSFAHFSGGDGNSRSCITVNGETKCEESSGSEGGTTLQCVSGENGQVECETHKEGGTHA